MPTAEREASRWPLILPVLAISLLGLALRLPLFGDSLWGDELSTNFVVHGFGRDSLLGIVGSDQEGTPPLYFMLTWLVKDLGGVESLRLVSLVAGVAAIPVTYLVGERTVGRQAALLGAGLVSLSPFLIFYSTEARAYSLATLMVLLATLSLLIATEPGRSRWWWAAYAVSTAAAVCSHYVMVFALGGLFLWALFARPDARRWLLLGTAGALVLFLPWLPELVDDGDEAAAKIIEAIFPLTWAAFRTQTGAWAFGSPHVPVSDLPGDPAVAAVFAGLALGVIGLALRVRGDETRWWPPPAGPALVVVLALATPLGAVVHNFFSHSVFISRNLVAGTPGLLLTFAVIATAARGWLRVASIGLVLGGYAAGSVQMLDADNRKPDLQAVAEFIEERGEPGSPVVDMPQPSPGPQVPLEYAFAEDGQPLPDDRSIFVLDSPSFEDRLARAGPGEPDLLAPIPQPSPEEVARKAATEAGNGTLFLVAPERASLESLATGIYAPSREFLAALPPRFEPVERREFPGVTQYGVSVYVFEGAAGG